MSTDYEEGQRSRPWHSRRPGRLQRDWRLARRLSAMPRDGLVCRQREGDLVTPSWAPDAAVGPLSRGVSADPGHTLQGLSRDQSLEVPPGSADFWPADRTDERD